MSMIQALFGSRKKTADTARERLQIILPHERSSTGGGMPDYLPALKEELLAVISKYVCISHEDIKVHLERQDNLEVLEVNIVLPEQQR